MSAIDNKSAMFKVMDSILPTLWMFYLKIAQGQGQSTLLWVPSEKASYHSNI